ncbi:histone-like transcription factor and archaeal histone family [Fusarium longipes]|uniref:Histone-like transcription factor and archaeal histone family n=1 Tax=Fusarium longipes TaxID=694270 RepID=A0A395T1B0_9HYPO|nr:histone-like transcription factor and archaeal histone family [Fusarium longipes]
MPYNTTAIPPRKEPTGQNQLPLSRVKKIIAQDPEIGLCSNNAAFVITLAAEMFVQHLAEESHTQAKLDRKPRRNIQYKDVASAISHHDNLEFLEDVVPKTVPYKHIKATAKATQARLQGDNSSNQTINFPVANGAKKPLVNGSSTGTSAYVNDGQNDPNSQLELESRQAGGMSQDRDVAMTG